MSGLNLALTNALSGLNVAQQSLATASGNITNANTPGYSRKVTNNETIVSQGVTVGANPVIQRVIDEFLSQAQRQQTTATSNAQVINDYMQRIQTYLGSTDSTTGTTVMSALDNFFSAVSNVSSSPDQPYFRTQAVQSATTLAQTISTLATNLQNTRYQADQDIADAVKNVNTDLDKLNTINTAIRAAYISGAPQDALLDQRDKALKDLTQYLDVGVAYNDDNEVSLFNQAGEILSPSTQYHLTYSPSTSLDTLSQDKKLDAIKIVPLDANGNLITQNAVTLAASASSSQMTTDLQSGKIKGLMQIRDTDIPKMLQQLDSLTNGLVSTVNAINNSGVGYPPPTTLTGTRQITGNTQLNFTGSARIAALDSTGKPAASPYSNDQSGLMRPLTINFGQLYGPTGYGKPTVTDVVKAINQYYGPPQNRASMGSLANVQLSAISDNTTGPFQFGLQFDNPSANPLNITIVSVNGVPSGASVTASPGQVTSSAPTVTFSSAGAGPYTIPVEVMMTDPVSGTTYHDTINYTVPAAASGARGNMYSVTSLGGTNVPPESGATIIVPDTNKRLMTAQMVDANGNVVTNPSQAASLQLLGNNGTTIAIDELDSKDIGNPNANVVATNAAFSDFFQMNDFFERNTDTAPGNAATNLKVKQAIISNPNMMAVGRLTQSSQPSGAGALPLYTYEVGIASNQAAEDLSALQNKSITFGAAGSLPAFTNTASAYASEIYSFAGGLTTTASSNLDQQNILQKSYDDRASSVSGVNLDEELANTVLYQNAYSASARIITVVNSLFNTLLQIGQ